MPDRRSHRARTNRHSLPGAAFAVAALLALAACGDRQSAQCDRVAAAEIAFSGGQTPDGVTARTFGPSCDRAIGVIAIASPEGHPLWAWTAPLSPTFGNAFEVRPDGPTNQEADAFLARWAAVRVTTTETAPPWPQRGALEGATTTLDRTTYEDVRARALPMACHLSGVAHETCVYYEPGVAAAVLMLDRDVPATDTE